MPKTPQHQDPDAEPAIAERAAPAPAEKATVESWAQRKGMLPQFIGGARLQIPAQYHGHGAVPVQLGMAGAVPPSPNPEFVKFAAARAMLKWPEGAEVTEAEFDKAVHDATDGAISR